MSFIQNVYQMQQCMLKDSLSLSKCKCRRAKAIRHTAVYILFVCCAWFQAFTLTTVDFYCTGFISAVSLLLRPPTMLEFWDGAELVQASHCKSDQNSLPRFPNNWKDFSKWKFSVFIQCNNAYLVQTQIHSASIAERLTTFSSHFVVNGRAYSALTLCRDVNTPRNGSLVEGKRRPWFVLIYITAVFSWIQETLLPICQQQFQLSEAGTRRKDSVAACLATCRALPGLFTLLSIHHVLVQLQAQQHNRKYEHPDTPHWGSWAA